MKYVYLVILLFNINLFAFESSDSVFQKSNKLYESADFEKSIAGYLSILDQDIDNQILLYNIANAYYRLNKLGYARLYYEKAKLYNSKDKDVNHNLHLLESQLIDDIMVVPDFFLIKSIKKINNLFNPQSWGLVTLIILYLTVLLFLILFFSQSSKLKLNIVKSFFVIVPVFVFSLFFMIYSNSTSTKEFAILISSNAYIKTAPSVNADDYFILHEGAKFKLIDTIEDWSRISLDDGKDGWLENKHFLIIDK